MKIGMKMDYDLQNDSLFLYRDEKYIYKQSVELGENCILDFNEDSDPVSMEILNISKILDVKKFSIKNVKHISGEIGISEDSICLKLSIIVPVHQKRIKKPMLVQTTNDINLPNTLTQLATA